ncbi:sugar kinase [Pseudalkalibacillus salsuginis]|uniref:sugar kinase n=1 Tax=Pseudalkalibacillus salsuginis TaxID=2910972 RepID=UPI001F43BA70|nr:sugar kinase [Pseudalkalibacillus salsuginis]MCF6411325.1 sugar kinase [Pseudalkalibacillus salsuginis]
MDIITIGETMVLFEPFDDGSIQYTNAFHKRIGGAESNVAIGLSKLGHSVAWVSRLGDDPFGRYIHAYVRGEGVDVSRVTFDSTAPTGIYFKEKGTFNQTLIHYYRKQSAASKMKPGDVDEEMIKKAKYLHITGITPALSNSCHQTILHAVKVAKEHGVKIIFDPNLRKKLWDEADYIPIMKELIKYSDYFLPGTEELHALFPDGNVAGTIEELLGHGVEAVILKKGAEGASYHTKEESSEVSGYPNDHVKDPVGAGDGFATGFISGLLDGLTLHNSVKRANLVGSMVTMVKGDCEGLPSRNELLSFTENTSDVQR